MPRDVLTLILAGGRGSRLGALTRDRAKPAVPFGGHYRIIDFPLSNCINSGLRRILVLTQYKARSLDRHISAGWSFLSRTLNEYVDVLPAQQQIGETWYKGTADALYQNIYTLEKAEPRDVLILAGDHIYKMDYSAMIAAHRRADADATVACINVPRSDASRFGILTLGAGNRVTQAVEKPAEPGPGPFLASMGVYLFKSRVLYEQLCLDATRPESRHEIGTDLLGPMLSTHRVIAYPFQDLNAKAVPYWRDVGTIDAYYQATMDLVAVEPELNLYDRAWPIRTLQPMLPPPKFVHGEQDRRGEAIMSLVCQGCIVSGGSVRHSVLSPGVRIHSYALVEESILLDGVEVGRHCRIRRAIVDKDVKLPQNITLGHDHDHDRARGFQVTESGIVIVPKAEPPQAFLGGK
jgi:glucose-1-phosphate adenylyltransferase